MRDKTGERALGWGISPRYLLSGLPPLLLTAVGAVELDGGAGHLLAGALQTGGAGRGAGLARGALQRVPAAATQLAGVAEPVEGGAGPGDRRGP